MRPFFADAFATGWGEVNVDIGFKANIGNAAAVLTGINFNYSNPIDNNKDNFTDLTLQDRISVFQNGVSTERTTNYSLAGRYFMKTDGEANCNGKKIPRWN
jgi:outer membrane receptor for ferrienterochelin and colicins